MEIKLVKHEIQNLCAGPGVREADGLYYYHGQNPKLTVTAAVTACQMLGYRLVIARSNVTKQIILKYFALQNNSRYQYPNTINNIINVLHSAIS